MVYGEIVPSNEQETERETKLINELMDHRSRANFLQKKVGAVQVARNREPTGDAEQEFAKLSKPS